MKTLAKISMYAFIVIGVLFVFLGIIVLSKINTGFVTVWSGINQCGQGMSELGRTDFGEKPFHYVAPIPTAVDIHTKGGGLKIGTNERPCEYHGLSYLFKDGGHLPIYIEKVVTYPH